MKINFMMTLIAISFVTVVGLMGVGYWTAHEAVEAGLQQCRVGNEVIWQKVCL
jgi:hypothetical protein